MRFRFDQARVNVIEATRADSDACPAPKNFPAAESRCTALDGFRGGAILLVLAAQFWAHVPHAQEGPLVQGVSKLAAYGTAGIALFFLLSGFWIARSLIRQHGRGSFFGRFFLRRACRILPVYWLLLVGAYLGAKALYPLNADLWEPTVSEHMPRWVHAVFMQNVFMALTGSQGCAWLNPTWVLAVEVQFYLLLPVVVWFVAPRWLPIAAGLGIVACWAFRWEAHARDAHAFLSSLTLPGRGDSLFLGVLVACAWENARVRTWLRQHRNAVLVPAVCAALGFVVIAEFSRIAVTHASLAVAGPALLGLVGAAAMIDLLAHENSRVARALSARPLVFWGGISFFVYLAHQPVNSLLHAAVLQDWPQVTTWAGGLVTLGSVAGVAVLGGISRRWFEGPIVAWSRRVRFSRHRLAHPALEAMPVAYAPPLVRWTRGLAGMLGRPALRMARAMVRVR